MPVDSHATHPSTQRTNHRADCHSKDGSELRPSYETFTGERVQHNLTYACRQMGRKYNGAWVPLDECMGCKSVKDEAYITKARQDIDRESKRFMKADQR